VQRQFAVHLRNKAFLCKQVGQRQEARDALDQAADILQGCVQSNPTNVSCRRYLATVYSRLGELCADDDPPNDALTYLTQAREIQSKVAAQNPAVFEIQLEHVQTLVHILDVKAKTQAEGHALPELAAVKKALLDLTSKGTQRASDQRSAAVSLLKVAQLELRWGDVSGATELHEKGMGMLSRLLDGARNRASLLQQMGDHQEEFAAVLRVIHEFEAAEMYYRKAIELRTQRFGKTSSAVVITLAQLALVQAAARDIDGYTETCETMYRDFHDVEDPKLMNLVAWTCSLLPDGSADPAQMVTLSEKAVAANPQDRLFLNTLGLALFRAGDNAGALKKLQMAMNASATDDDALDELFLSMIYFKMGRDEEALEAWRAMEQFEPPRESGGDLTKQAADAVDAIEREIFLLEAKQLMGRGDKGQ
jgi:tetratricopeptide (TPR) repeat protein